jgi:glutathione-specific gamma-glutamylcyclotransferase
MHISASPPTPVQPTVARAAPADALASLPAGDMWVFAYGSLMWNPGFVHVRAQLAQIHGYHRALCVWSWVHRGTQERPGLVLGLDRGGSCLGVAHCVPAAEREAATAYLYERELVTHVYQPVVRRVRVQGIGTVAALTFVVNRRHSQYAGELSPAEAARIIRGARGRSGPNPEYFANTLTHMEALGIRCRRLRAIQRALDAGAARGA